MNSGKHTGVINVPTMIPTFSAGDRCWITATFKSSRPNTMFSDSLVSDMYAVEIHEHSKGVVISSWPSSRAPTAGIKYCGSNMPTSCKESDAIRMSAASCGRFAVDTTGYTLSVVSRKSSRLQAVRTTRRFLPLRL